jgi:hypothetical protein
MKNTFKVISITLVLIFTLTAASCSVGDDKSFNSAKALKAYLNKQPTNSPDRPIKVSIDVNERMLPKIGVVLKDAGKYVNLNITGNTLKTIGESSFVDCANLTSVTIPNSVTSIGNCAFMYCISLTNVTIPDSVTNIRTDAFSCCTSLTDVTIPNSVTGIDARAFNRCHSLTSITFESKITSDNFGNYHNILDTWFTPFDGDLRDKYLAGGPGTYITTAPVNDKSVWTKK